MKQVKGFTKEYYIEKCKDDGGVPILYSNMQEAVKALCEYVLTVQQNCVVTEQVVAIAYLFEVYGSPGNDLFRVAGLVAANYGIGHINSACVQGRLLSSGVISVLTADIFSE